MTETLRFNSNLTTIKVSIGERNIEIINHFSFKLSLKFIEQSEKTKDFRNSFIESVYDMYTKAIAMEQENDTIKISKSDFSCIEESELTKIFEAILSNDNSTFEVYRQIDCVDPYERYYLALKKLYQQSFQLIGESIQKSVDSFKSIIEPLEMYKFDHLISPIDEIITPMDRLISPIKIDIPKIEFPNIDLFEITNNVKEMQLQKLSELSLVVNSTIQTNEKFKENFGFAKSILRTSSVFHNQLTGIISEFDSISKKFTSIISSSLQPTFDMLATINTGLDYVDKHYKERHEILRSFGWWYLSDLDEELLEKIYVNQGDYTKKEVDQIICNYYRENRCEKLKKMVKGWKELEYFQTRKTDIHQIRVIHGQKYFNSSVTLLTILIEGITRDFIKLQSGEGYYRFSRVRKELRMEVENNYEFSLLEFKVANHVLENIEEVFGGSFDPSAPQKTPDYKRDKRMHGQAFEEQEESDSLKLFLQLNELYNLFSSIENRNDKLIEVTV